MRVDERDVDAVVLRQLAGAADAREPAADDDDPRARGGVVVIVRSSGGARGRVAVAVPLLDVDPAAAEGVDPAPAAGDVEQLEMADRRRAATGSTTRCSPTGSSPSIVRSSSSGAPVDHAWGLQAVGYWTGYFVTERS